MTAGSHRPVHGDLPVHRRPREIPRPAPDTWSAGTLNGAGLFERNGPAPQLFPLLGVSRRWKLTRSRRISVPLTPISTLAQRCRSRVHRLPFRVTWSHFAFSGFNGGIRLPLYSTEPLNAGRVSAADRVLRIASDWRAAKVCSSIHMTLHRRPDRDHQPESREMLEI